MTNESRPAAEETGTTGSGDDVRSRRARELLEQSATSYARIAPPAWESDPDADPRAGGEASKAPASLSAAEPWPVEGNSSGRSWDDPDEL